MQLFVPSLLQQHVPENMPAWVTLAVAQLPTGIAGAGQPTHRWHMKGSIGVLSPERERGKG